MTELNKHIRCRRRYDLDVNSCLYLANALVSHASMVVKKYMLLAKNGFDADPLVTMRALSG